MSLHGSSHVTFDLDIIYDREPSNLERVVTALAPLRPRLRGVSDDVPFRLDTRTLAMGLNFTLRTEAGDIDLLGAAPGAPEFSELEHQAQSVDLGDLKVLVASLEDLIQMKTTAGRTKDKLHLLELDRLKILRSQSQMPSPNEP